MLCITAIDTAIDTALEIKALATSIGLYLRSAQLVARAVLLCGLFLPGFAWADQSTNQIALAATGRFDQLEKQLEAQLALAPLDTRDRHALCWTYSKTKRYTKLMACLDELELTLKKGSKRTRLFALDDATPSLGIMRAEALLELGQYTASVAEAKRNLEWLKKDASDDLDMVVNTMAVLSMALTLSGDKDSGFQIAQQLAQTRIGILSPYAGAKAMALARARMALGDYAGVIDALNADKTFTVNVFLDRLVTGGFFTGINNWVWVELPRAFMLNKALMETGRIDEAKAGYDRLLGIRQTQENGEIYWLILNDRGYIADLENERNAALAYYRQAIDVVEEQRASINTETGKIGFVGDKQVLYSRAISDALELKQTTLAYEYMERAKSRALVDLLAGKNVRLGVKSSSKGAEIALASYQQASENARAQLPLDMASISVSEGRSAVKVSAQELKKTDPELASLVTVSALPLTEVRTYLQPDEVLVEYYMYRKQLFILAISADSFISTVIDASNLEQEIRSFRSSIESQKSEALNSAQALYTKLLKPIEKVIAGRNLFIVPHGILHYLPFAALHDGQNYLLTKHSVRYLPSASVQKYIRPQRGTALDNMLIFGNPDLDRPELDLPSAEEEAKMIAQMVPQSKIFTRLAASETAFKQFAGNYRYLHLATHGQFNSESPLQSRVILAADKNNDGYLTVGEIYGLRLNAELVTLSACETGLAKSMNGDDVIGMTRGFLYAGSSNIIASLWEVDDAATSELMKQFYRNIKAGQSKKEALRNAQQSLWPKFPHPVFWAAFFLTGQGQ